ncbi:MULTISPECIES: helix-turn-helix domain-containing protein [unclassified Brevundimonas]|uniref:helix-turn-helix domain-containing protein n=1 Tax=unclassified Brevundimonas TaxID=2622653 RepID=UPI0025B8D82D|nr:MULTISPECIES: helix-turn-helix transcriptional regulator [unclassified Brevundimonas]
MARRSEDIDHWVGERIGQMRRDRGLSQGALASALGLSFQQVQKYEAGLNRVSAARLFQLSQLFECPVSAFFPHNGERSMTERAEATDLDADELRRLTEAFGRIGEARVRQSVLEVVQALALR